MKAPRRKDKGTILLMTVIIIVVLAALGFTCVVVMETLSRDSLWQERRAQALFLAEAGVEHMLRKLGTNQTWPSMYGVAFASGTFDVTATTDAFPIIQATGFAQALKAQGTAFRTIQGQYENVYIPQLSYGMLAGTSGIDLTAFSSKTDSYDSSVSSDPVSFGTSAVVYSNGKVDTTGRGIVVINGNVTYHNGFTAPAVGTYSGTRTGTNGNVDMTADGVSGWMYVNQNDDLTGISPQSAYTDATKTLLVASGSTVTLNSGTYYFKSITVNGALTANITTGPVAIFFEGSLAAAGNIGNPTKIPGNLLLYAQDGGKTVTLASSAKFYGVVSSSANTVNLNQTMYGAIVAAGIVVGTGALLHYDTNLAVDIGATPAGSYAVFRRSNTWKELPYRI